ncbi:MAG: hypothetical protein Q8R55_04680 [Candidatus Taylorbacteria bacterium]|nr:hypothetical protein [Candidatus Taylorbacteria bacterium]
MSGRTSTCGGCMVTGAGVAGGKATCCTGCGTGTTIICGWTGAGADGVATGTGTDGVGDAITGAEGVIDVDGTLC